MKKMLALALALMLALSLAACGGGNDPAPSGSEGGAPSSQQAEQQPSDTPDPGADEPDNSGGDDQDQSLPKVFSWPNETYTPESMKWTGSGKIVNVKEEEYSVGKYRMAVRIDQATFEEIGAYVEVLKEDGFVYQNKLTGDKEPELKFDNGYYFWYGEASDGRFVEIQLTEKEATADYRNDTGEYIDYTYQLYIGMYPENKNKTN